MADNGAPATSASAIAGTTLPPVGVPPSKAGAASPAAATESQPPSESRRRKAARVTRSLDSMDLEARAGPLINSPRSLLACAEEGIDPDTELVKKDLKDFMGISKGDAEIAKVRLQHYQRRREELLAAARRHREAIVTAMAEPTVQRRVATPLAAPSIDLTGVAPSTDATQPHSAAPVGATSHREQQLLQHSPGRRSDSVGGPDSGRRPSETRTAATTTNSDKPGGLSPEEYMREKAQHKKAKLVKQVERMRQVIEANAAYERQKMAFLQAQREKLEEQERAAERRREREEQLRRIKVAEHRKHEAEQLVQRELRDQQLKAKQEELHEQRVARLVEIERRDRERVAKIEEHRGEQELAYAEKRQMVELRTEAILEHSERVQQSKKEALEKRTSHAEEMRQKLHEQHEQELQERRKHTEIITRERKEARHRAEETFASKLTRYVEKAAKAAEKRAKAEQEKQNFLLCKRLEEEEKEKERLAIIQRVREEEERKAHLLLDRLSDEEKRVQRLQEERERDARLRAAEKDLVVQDRAAAVQRLRRVVLHNQTEAERRFEEKIAKINRLRREQEEMDGQRKKISHELFLAKRELPPTSVTPGPLDYAAVDAFHFAVGPGPGVRLGRPSPVFKPAKELAPGPGAYGAPSVPRHVRGGVMPRRDATLEELLVRRERSKARSSGRGSTTGSPSTSPPRSQSALPSIGRSHPAGSSATRDARVVGGAASVDRPPELTEEDYNSDDDFDSVHDG